MAKITQFRGIRNTVKAHQLSFGSRDNPGVELSAAENVDINDAMRLKRRPGAAMFSEGAADSLFRHGNTVLFRRDNALRLLHPDGTDDVLVSGVNNPVNYCATDRIYWSDGLQAGAVLNGINGPWGITPPMTAPDHAMIPDGALPRGRYLYAVTYLVGGEESGTGPSGETDEIEGSIQFTNIPDGAEKAIYLSRPNGQTLYRAMVLPQGVTEAVYGGTANELTVALETQFKQPPPPARAMAEHNGSVLLGVGRHLLYSDMYRHGLFDPVRQSFAFESEVLLVAPVQGGVFVGTQTHIIYMGGDDISAANQDVKADYGAISGTLDYVEAQNLPLEIGGVAAIFATSEGICVGGQGGTFINLTINRYAYPSATAGTGKVRLADGSNRYLAVLRD